MAMMLPVLVAVVFAYAWGVACGYGWGRVMTSIERRELDDYRRRTDEWLAAWEAED